MLRLLHVNENDKLNAFTINFCVNVYDILVLYSVE